MRAELSRLHERLGVTTIYVTHDQVEAMTLGQRVAVMRDGRIQQVDAPQNLYQEPANLFVAAFIGSPSMNLVEATVADGARRVRRLQPPARAGAASPTSADGRCHPRHPARRASRTLAFADPTLPQIDAEVSVLEELGSDATSSSRSRRRGWSPRI